MLQYPKQKKYKLNKALAIVHSAMHLHYTATFTQIIKLREIKFGEERLPR